MGSQRWQRFFAVVCIGGLLWGIVVSLGLSSGTYWCIVVVLALLAAGSGSASRSTAPRAWGGGRFLCDGCKYNDARYCDRPERPNATECPDYQAR
jgi:hypothetical protein